MNKLIELNEEGMFLGDIPFFGGDITIDNWTRDYPPNGMYSAKYNGTRLDTGEWIDGEWIDTVENNIGLVVYNTTTKEQLKIIALGPIPEGYTTQVPKEFDYWDGSLWITDIALRNTVLKARKLAEINHDLEVALSALRVEYPESEIMSWVKQESEARSWLRDNTRPTPLIDLIASSRGLDKALLINKVIQKSDQYAFAVGTAIGRRQMLEDQIKAIAIGQESLLDQIKF